MLLVAQAFLGHALCLLGVLVLVFDTIVSLAILFRFVVALFLFLFVVARVFVKLNVFDDFRQQLLDNLLV